MGALLALILPSLIPAGLDAVKGLFSAAQRKWLGLTVDEEIKLDEAAVKRLEALAKLDDLGSTQPSQWVVDLRSSFRYIAACISILAGIGLGYTALYSNGITSEEMSTVLLPLALDLIGIPFSFIFGERLWAGMKGVKK
jgi:hypothetical protein